MKRVRIVGGGLAGSEAAWQCAIRGLPVTLYEMRPQRETAAHKTGNLAELVCSNSFKSVELVNAHGLLKEEMRRVGSLILEAADAARVPAGAALAVDRETFSGFVGQRLADHPLIDVVREEVQTIPEPKPGQAPTILATGPLCSQPLAQAIMAFSGEENLAFYDAISPIVDGETIDWDIAFRASRYNKGSGTDYVNCPMDKEEYDRFYDELLAASRVEMHDFDRKLLFEGCLPVEELAMRGRDTLRFGPMKPVGLKDPRTDRRPWAVVQLRQDNLAATHWNMVGFQNRLKWGEQKRICRLIPGLENAEFVRMGMIHRNTYVNAPRMLMPTFQSRTRADLLFAGQISGVEGYTESTASGMIAGLTVAALEKGLDPPVFPRKTALGSLQHYISHADPEDYQPTNMAFGLIPPLDESEQVRIVGKGRDRRRERKKRLAERALSALGTYLSERSLFSATGYPASATGPSATQEQSL